MSTKPFLAARIPENLNLKLDEYSKATGESRTQVLINALAAYLGISTEIEKKGSPDDRISALEKKIEKLENILMQPQQFSLLDIPTEFDQTSQTHNRQEIEADDKNDNKVDNDFNEMHQSPLKNNLSNREIAEMTGIKFETVRSKHRHNTPIEFGGKTYLPIKDGKSCKWQFV